MKAFCIAMVYLMGTTCFAEFQGILPSPNATKKEREQIEEWNKNWREQEQLNIQREQLNIQKEILKEQKKRDKNNFFIN